MKRKVCAAFLTLFILVSTMSGAGTCVFAAQDGESAALSEIETTGNRDLYGETGEELQDDTYQYFVENDDYTAFMWVPESAEHLNGLMVAKSNLIEDRLLESVTVREVLAKYNIGVVYLHARSTTDKPSNSNIIGDFVYIGDEAFDKYKSANNYTYSGPANAGSILDEALARLAAVSGFDELTYAPLIGVGHSAGMGLGRALGSWEPSRAIAQICLKGGSSLIIPGVTRDGVGDNYEIQPGVPTYLAAGQFTEHASYDNPAGKDNYIDGEINNFANIRAKGTDRLVTMSVDWESGHYDWSESSNEAVANYLDSVIPMRLGAQATSQEQIPEDYQLVDLTGQGYVSDVKVLGTRTTSYTEASYKHGSVIDANITEEEQKSMIWFPSEENYEFIRDFTAERKDAELIDEPIDGGESEPEDNEAVVYAESDMCFNEVGAEQQWPPGNYSHFVGNNAFIALSFDMSDVIASGRDVSSISFEMVSSPGGSHNGNATYTVYQTTESPFEGFNATNLPQEPLTVLENATVNADETLTIDVSELSYSAESPTVYLVATCTSSNDFYSVIGSRKGTEATSEDQQPKLVVKYAGASEPNVYADGDMCFNATGGEQQWPPGNYSHFVGDGAYIALSFDMSEAIASGQDVSSISFEMVSSPGGSHNGNATYTVYQTTESPFEGFNASNLPQEPLAVLENATVNAGETLTIDVSELSYSAESPIVYLVATCTSSNDFYSVIGSGKGTEATSEGQQPKLVIEYVDDSETDPGTGLPLVSYASYDRSYNTTSGDLSSWQGAVSYYVSNNQSLIVEYDLSAFSAEDADKIVSVGLTIPWRANNGTRACVISETTANPWSNGHETFAVPADLETVASDIQAQAIRDIDVTAQVKSAIGSGATAIYFNVSSTEEGNGADFYCVVNYENCQGYTTDKANMPRLSFAYSESDPPEEDKTKHQYLKMEDPASGEPRDFTRITRYDRINPNDASYTNNYNDDPMTFSMVVDKMAVVTEDHLNEGQNVVPSDTPAYITPVMAPVEWVGVEEVELTQADTDNGVASKWRNYLRWKNNRVYYHMASQDSYLNLNTFDVYDQNGELEYAYATNTFQIAPLSVSDTDAAGQVLTVGDISDMSASDTSGQTFSATSSAGLPVDIMVDYGPVKVTELGNGEYNIELDQVPAGATYPIECKIVATQFGVNNNGTKIRTATPVEKTFYIYEDGAEAEAIDLEQGVVNQTQLKYSGATGLYVEGAGTVTLKMNTDTKFDAERAAEISAERANSEDENYRKHYRYPEGYNPYDYWEDYPGEWTATVAESGFVPFSAFTNADRPDEVLNLDYINRIVVSEGITAVTSAADAPAPNKLKANGWGDDGVNLVWEEPIGDKSGITVYAKENDGEYVEVQPEELGDTYALITGLNSGSNYSFRVQYEGGDAAEITDVYVGGKTYLIDDFECGSLSSGMDWMSYADMGSKYAFSSYMGEALLLSGDEDNHYLAMQNTYNDYVQTANINIPGGLTKDMLNLVLDIKVDKLEDSTSNSQVYFEFLNPETGAAYGIEKGSDFSLEDKSWHEEYTIILSEINGMAELTEEELSGITVLRIGRRTPGGGNNNRRAKIYVDNIELSSQSAYTISNLDAVSGNGKLSLYWDEPNVTYSDARVYVNDELKAELLSGVRGYTVEGLTEGETYNVRVDIVNSGEVTEGETYRLTVGALDTAAAAANTEFGDFTLNASNSSAAKTIDGRYVALTGADAITLNVGGADTTDAGDVYIDLIENDENGERFRAPIGMYASGESKELTIPIEAFECVSQRNNGSLDLAAVKYISAGAVFEEGSADQISVAGMRAETYTVAEDSDVTISSVEASSETGKSDVTIEVAAELNTANAGLYVAAYDAAGTLADAAVLDTARSATVTLESADSYRAFVWDKTTQEPLTNEIGEYPAEIPDTDYTITVINSDRGTVTAPASAKAGEVVTVTVEGITEDNVQYNVESFNLRDDMGNEIPVINNKFIMPASNVTMEPVFAGYDVRESVLEMQDTISIQSGGYQNSSNLVMIGRNRLGFIKYDISGLSGTVSSAVINAYMWRGSGSAVAVFAIPNNDWTGWLTYGGDTGALANQNTMTLDGSTRLNSVGENGVNLFSDGGRSAVFTDYTPSSDNDTDPGRETQTSVAQSASRGILNQYFFGDTFYASSGNVEIDVTDTVNQAVANGEQEITLMLYTPYVFASTVDIYTPLESEEYTLDMDVTTVEKRS